MPREEKELIRVFDSPTPTDPAKMGFPVTLPVEIVLKTASIRDLCDEYRITRAEWNDLRQDPTFQKAVATAHEQLQQDGMSFKMKARLQAEQLLQTSWELIHENNGAVPPVVKADLLKFIVRVAGLDASADKGAASQANALQININLG